jgi:catechol 2,3-dioxygenase-like lactoylglutathione lyase family enzyme
MSGTDTPTVAAANFEGVTPILRVRSLQASIDYYVGVLGFKVDWQHAAIVASVSRNRAGIMLCEGDQGNPGTWLWFGVTDADVLFDEFRNAGAKIGLAPTNYSWAYEFHVQDPDGHVLRFGSDSKEDRPFSPWVAWYQDEEQARDDGHRQP